jgi:hypothetical protein
MKQLLFLTVFGFFMASLYAQNYDKANPPINVTINGNILTNRATTTSKITWAAAENSMGYEIFYQMEGSKIIESLPGSIDVDKTTDTYAMILTIKVHRLLLTNTRWRFGIRSSGKVDSNGRISGPSDIVWTDYILFSSRYEN